MSPKIIASALLVTGSTLVAVSAAWADGYLKSHGLSTYSEGCNVVAPGQSMAQALAACSGDEFSEYSDPQPWPVAPKQVIQVPEIRVEKIPVVKRVYEERIERVPVVKRVEEIHIEKVPVIKRVYEHRIEKVPVIKRVEVLIIEKVPVIKKVYEQKIVKVQVPVVQEVPQIMRNTVPVLKQSEQIHRQIVPVQQQTARFQHQVVPILHQQANYRVQRVPVIGQQPVYGVQRVPVTQQIPQPYRQFVPVPQRQCIPAPIPAQRRMACGAYGCFYQPIAAGGQVVVRYGSSASASAVAVAPRIVAQPQVFGAAPSVVPAQAAGAIAAPAPSAAVSDIAPVPLTAPFLPGSTMNANGGSTQAMMTGTGYVTNGYATNGDAASSFVQSGKVGGFGSFD